MAADNEPANRTRQTVAYRNDAPCGDKGKNQALAAFFERMELPLMLSEGGRQLVKGEGGRGIGRQPQLARRAPTPQGFWQVGCGSSRPEASIFGDFGKITIMGLRGNAVEQLRSLTTGLIQGDPVDG
jgi:hypothetical protein